MKLLLRNGNEKRFENIKTSQIKSFGAKFEVHENQEYAALFFTVSSLVIQ